MKWAVSLHDKAAQVCLDFSTCLIFQQIRVQYPGSESEAQQWRAGGGGSISSGAGASRGEDYEREV